jgi:pyruvate formate lyase activating enzyme
VGEGSPAGIVIDRERCTGCGKCVDFCAASALEMHGRTLSVKDLYDEVIQDVVFYETSEGGVTLSGGEPLAQPKAALKLLAMLREARIHAALDTCGAVNEWALREALGLVDLVLFDVKTTDPAAHERLTGVPFDQVAASARLVAESGLAVWIRTPVIPGYTADEATIQGVARFVAETFDNCERHDLLAFSNLCSAKYEQLERPFPLAGAPLLDAQTMQHLSEVAQAAGSVHAVWSGPTRLGETGTI